MHAALAAAAGSRRGGPALSSGQGDDSEETELESPYWHVAEAVRYTGLWRMLRRLPATTRPVVALLLSAGRWPAVTILVLQVASGLATALGLLATTSVFEELLAGGPTGERVVAALPALALLVGVYTFRGSVDAGVTLAQARLVPRVRRLAEERLMVAAVRVELAAFDDPAFYDRLHRARDRALYYLERAVNNMVELIGASFAVLAAAGSLSVLHPVLLPVLAVAVLPEGWAVLRVARLGYDSMVRTSALDRRVRMMLDLATVRDPAAEIRVCQAQPFVLDEYRQVADELCRHEVRVGVDQARTRAVGRALAGIVTGATFVLLGALLHAGWIPLAVAGTAVIAIRSATAALTRLVIALNLLFEQSLYVGDYQEFLADADSRSRSSGRVGRMGSAAAFSLTTPEGGPADRDGARTGSEEAGTASAGPQAISLSGVDFRYPGSPEGMYALREVELTLYAGQTVALVGENGSGKSTLAKIIAGLYRPTSGTVAWDGTDLREIDDDGVADRIVLVSQHPVRWPHNARMNVRVGRYDRPDPGDLALRSAADRARVTEVVETLPKGWDTLLSKYFRGGHELSGGQWQRLAVARGLYRDAPLLIWDEPTAPLDAKAEYAVYETLRRIGGGRTVVLITHRLASVRNADQIHLLHKGRIIESGTHPELVANGGRYAEMYELQARMYAATPEETEKLWQSSIPDWPDSPAVSTDR
ncbi:ABC transporter ATP-binding protein [Rhizohabitans arisaemae]|uniref:ABC transporter ATP-binding protein n=1 Tax=Rhizohabitans arisaemae TaxID=2720610 RepID=UPI0024B14856|nr:ABC transporter ATP-binding protein [Rhizohabitans arisaemae]